MQPRTARFIVKGIFGLAVSCLLGTIVKLEHKVEDRIDDYYADEEPEPDPIV